MKFKVTRTSLHGAPDQPCPEAKREAYAVEDVEAERWIIEIDSFDELIGFVKRRGGEIVISTRWTWDDDPPEIEIYDELRE